MNIMAEICESGHMLPSDTTPASV